MPPPKTVLLDLDNTLIDYQLDFVGCWRRASEETTAALGRQDVEALLDAMRIEVRRTFTDPAENWFTRDLRTAVLQSAERSLARLGLPTSEAAGFVDRYDRVREETTRLFPGALEALARFRSAGVSLGLVTNGNAGLQRSKIRRFELDPLFDSIHVEGEVGVGKPDPRIFRAALEAHGTSPDETWMVGDNLEKDVAGAQAVGIHAVWCDSQREGLAVGSEIAPDRTVFAVAELAEDAS